MNDKRYWVGFNLVKGIGAVRLQALCNHFGDLALAWQAPADALQAAGLSPKLAERVTQVRAGVDLDKYLTEVMAQGIEILTWEDELYPPRLKEIDQPPPVLYLRGSITAKDCWAVAVVGTRRVSAYGRQVAEELASSSGANGVTVVSGLARGVDAIAHQSALKAGGRTIAVVVEAGGTSGALIPAQFALNQGREVFSVPGNILAPQSKGTNKLIAQGAHPMHSVRDLMNVLNLTRVTEHHLMRKVLPKDETELMLMGVLTR